MKLIASLFLFPTTLPMVSQMEVDYVIKLNNDTVFTKVIKIDHTLRKVICEENGKTIKYDAQNIMAIKSSTRFYESARVRLKKT